MLGHRTKGLEWGSLELGARNGECGAAVCSQLEAHDWNNEAPAPLDRAAQGSTPAASSAPSPWQRRKKAEAGGDRC